MYEVSIRQMMVAQHSGRGRGRTYRVYVTGLHEDAPEVTDTMVFADKDYVLGAIHPTKAAVTREVKKIVRRIVELYVSKTALAEYNRGNEPDLKIDDLYWIKKPAAIRYIDPYFQPVVELPQPRVLDYDGGPEQT